MPTYTLTLAGIVDFASAMTTIRVAPDIQASVSQATTFSVATASITSDFQVGQDVLGLINTTGEGNITASYSASTGVLTLSSAGNTATLAQWQTALQAVSYEDSSATPTAGVRAITFLAGDGTTMSAPVTRNVTVHGATPTPTPTPTTISASTIGLYRFYNTTTGTHFYTTNVNEAEALINPSSADYQSGMVQETSAFGAYSQSTADPNEIAVYRFFDPTNDAHFYTASASERDAIMNPASSDYQAAWIYEPTDTIYEHGTKQSGDVAVYRLFDTRVGAHFYTSDTSEIAGLTTAGSATYQPNLVSEGIAFYAPTPNPAAALGSS